jgi:hypothetical protein
MDQPVPSGSGVEPRKQGEHDGAGRVDAVARLLGGFSAGMAYPTTLALIMALWPGPGRRTAQV